MNTSDTVSSHSSAIDTAVADKDILHFLRRHKPARHALDTDKATTGARIADIVAATVGSWTFIIIQTVILFFWIIANVYGWMKEWDPYPFILLNLMLSFQAAYAAPFVMMSQNRQSDIDRKKAEKDYDINLKSELEIELLHQKIDLIREQEIRHLTSLIEKLLQEKEK